MRKRMMPDQQIAGIPADSDRLGIQLGGARICAERQGLQPRFNPPVESRNTAECSLVVSGVCQLQKPLRTKRDGRSQAYIPVQRLSTKWVPGPFRRIEPRLVCVHPNIGPSPKLRERGVNSG